MYQIIYSNDAEKFLRKCSKSLKGRIIITIERCRIRPYAYVKKLIGMPRFSLRIGDYRAILRINNGNLIILVVEVGHRKKVYK